MKNIFLIAILSSLTLSAVAKENMNVHLKDGKVQSFNVENVDKVTFSETQDPVAPSYGKLTGFNSWQFSYDSENRLNKIVNTEDELSYEFNHDTGKMIIMGMPVGSFTMNENGFLTSMTVDFFGSTSSMIFSYNDKGEMISMEQEGNSIMGYSNKTSVSYTWENGNLISYNTSITEDEPGEGTKEFKIETTYVYGNEENRCGQWFCGGFASIEGYDDDSDMDDEDLPLEITGWIGSAPAYFPTSQSVKNLTTGATSSSPISFTFNENGSIATQTIDGKINTFRYDDASRAKSSDNDAIMRGIRKLTGLFH